MTRANRGNNSIACAAASLPLITAGRGIQGVREGCQEGREAPWNPVKILSWAAGQVRLPGLPSTGTPPSSYPLETFNTVTLRIREFSQPGRAVHLFRLNNCKGFTSLK